MAGLVPRAIVTSKIEPCISIWLFVLFYFSFPGKWGKWLRRSAKNRANIFNNWICWQKFSSSNLFIFFDLFKSSFLFFVGATSSSGRQLPLILIGYKKTNNFNYYRHYHDTNFVFSLMPWWRCACVSNLNFVSYIVHENFPSREAQEHDFVMPSDPFSDLPDFFPPVFSLKNSPGVERF